MNGNAELGEFFWIHVAARAGAEEDDMLQPNAFSRDLGRQRGVIDDGDFGAVEDAGILIRNYIGIAMDTHRRIARLCKPFENHRQRFIGIDEYTAHENLLLVRMRRRPALAPYASAYWRPRCNRPAWRPRAHCG